MRGLVVVVFAGCGRVAFDPVTPEDAATDARADATISDAPVDAAGFGPWSPPAMVTAGGAMALGDDPSVTADGLELYFNDDRVIRVATRATISAPWSAPTAASGLGGMVFSPFVSADGLTMWGLDTALDIVVATRVSRSSVWSQATRIAAVSSGADDDGPSVTADGLTMVLDSTRDGDRDL